MYKIYIITGKQGSGKSTLIREVVSGLRKKGITVGGILAEGTWHNNQRDRFELVNIRTNERINYLQRQPRAGWERIRHFYLNPEGQKFGEQALTTDRLKDAGLIVIDEIGPFELRGKGWALAIQKIFGKLNIPVLISVRESLVDEIIDKWHLNVDRIFKADKTSSAQIVTDISISFSPKLALAVNSSCKIPEE